MKKIKVLMIAAFASLSLSTSTQAQGAIDGFFAEKGALSVTTSYTRGSFDEFYQGNELEKGVPAHEEITQDIISVFAKYEIAADFVAYVNLPYISAHGDGVADPANGETEISVFQYVTLGLKYRFHKFEYENSDLSLISGLAVGLPGDYEPNGILSIGSGAVTTDLTLGVHFGSDKGFFTTLLASYSFRDDTQENGDFDVPDAFLAVAKIGYANSFFYADAWLDFSNAVEGVDIGGNGFNVNGFNFPETRVKYTRVGGTLSKKIGDTGFSGSLAAGTVIDGRNLGKATTFSIGLTYDIELL